MYKHEALATGFGKTTIVILYEAHGCNRTSGELQELKTELNGGWLLSTTRLKPPKKWLLSSITYPT